MVAAHGTGQESLAEPPPGDCEGIAFGKTKPDCASKMRKLGHAHFGGRQSSMPCEDHPGLQQQLQRLWGPSQHQGEHAIEERQPWLPLRPPSGQLLWHGWSGGAALAGCSLGSGKPLALCVGHQGTLSLFGPQARWQVSCSAQLGYLSL